MEEAAVVETLLSCDYIDGVIANAPFNAAAMSTILGVVGMPKHLVDVTKLAIQGAEYLASLPAIYKKPLITIRFHRYEHDIVLDIMRGAGIPVYDTPEECARAMHALVKYAEAKGK